MRSDFGDWTKVVLPAAIVLLAAIVFARVPGAFFCSYDDYLELRRAAFEDTREPARVLATPHFGSYKYRPLNRGLNLLTYWAGGDRSEFFRLRNIGFHLLNVVLVYAVGCLLFRSRRLAAWAACLFGVHPLASVSVAGAVMTNTIAHAAALMALILFLTSVHATRYRGVRLVTGLVAAGIGLMTYDPDIVILGLMAVYLVLHAWARREPRIDGPLIVIFVVVALTLLGSYAGLRALFVPHGWAKAVRSVPSASVMAKNTVLYAVSLLSPVDPVLANAALNTPLPSEITIGPREVVLAGALGVLVLSALARLIWRRVQSGMIFAGAFDGISAAFALLGLMAPLVPVLLIEPHPSEAYLYLPVAFYLLLFVVVLHWVLGDSVAGRPRMIEQVVLLALLGMFSAATWVRNERLLRCGETSQRILTGLPKGILGEGAWSLRFANVPGEERSRRYGCYGFRGTDTIGDGSNADQAMTAALQVVFRNERLGATVQDPDKFSRTCGEAPAPRDICVWVHSDGRTEVRAYGQELE